MRITIGKAKFRDVFAISDLLFEARPETDAPVYDPDLPYAYSQLMEMMKRGAVFVARVNGDIVGFISAIPHQPWYKESPTHLQNQDFFVHADYRKGGTARGLVKKLTDEADRLGVPLVMTLDTGRDAEIKDRFVQRLGFVYMGGNLLYLPAATSPK